MKKDTATIYGIKNKKTGLYYVGSSRELDERWASHKALLEAGEHTPKLQSAWDESRPHDWEWLILEEGIPIVHQFHSEQHWIDALDAYNNGYNSSPRAGSYISIDYRGYRKFIDEREDDVLEMLAQIEDGIPYRTIAPNFGVSLGFLTNLKTRYTDLLSETIEAEAERKKQISTKKYEFQGRKKLKVERDKKIREMLNSGFTYRDIVREVGCALGTVTNVAKRFKQ